MIQSRIEDDGSLTVVISRCNKFNDHKTPEMDGNDGDIVLVLDGRAYKDVEHAHELIKRMRDRLGLGEDD